MKTSVLALALTAATGAASAQAPCRTPDHHRMDFWLGDWRLTFTGRDGERAAASNLIVKVEGGCVIEERFDGSASVGFTGRSWSMYDPATGRWRQTWVDSTGSYLLFEEGPAVDADFELIQTNVPDGGPFRRMIWTRVGDDELTWIWQGRKTPTGAWSDIWSIAYDRRS